MPAPLGPWDTRWDDSNLPDGPRAGRAPRHAIVPWFNTVWGNPRDDAPSEGRPGFAELPLLVTLAILGAGLPGETILISLGLTVALFAAIGRRPVAPGVVRGLIWLYRFLVAGEAVAWWTTWGATERPSLVLAEYSLVLLLVWLLVLAGRRVWAYARPA